MTDNAELSDLIHKADAVKAVEQWFPGKTRDDPIWAGHGIIKDIEAIPPVPPISGEGQIEREAIVDWLRQKLEGVSGCGEMSEYAAAIDNTAAKFDEFVDAIERGEHLPLPAPPSDIGD